MRAFARWTCAALLAALSLPGLVAAQSSNANLATVAVDYATLEPAFDPAITQYTATSDGNEFVCLFPAVDDPGATFLIDGMSAGFVCLDTTTFPRTAIVSVTAEDRITTRTTTSIWVAPFGEQCRYCLLWRQRLADLARLRSRRDRVRRAKHRCSDGLHLLRSRRFRSNPDHQWNSARHL
ncbi:MAG: hypothetical protein IPO08_19040 [Xanthomonadales bacterium]|nr:hypothetical protein [Xanthomonadales bacterium]